MAPTTGKSYFKHSIPLDILDDLCSRFIINLPPEDKKNLVRLCFQIELAHWFYLDYYCTDASKKLNPCGIRGFAGHIFRHVPQLRKHVSNLDEVLENWREYKQSVPTYGAILLDTDLTHVLLVQSYWAKASWGFPKGKVNEDEAPWKCAEREVLEETGFDISKLIDRDEFIEATIHDHIVRLYIIGHVPRNTKFEPRTRGEIKSCEWFPLDSLPTHKKDLTPKFKMGITPNAFFMVLPFIKRMRRWVADKKPTEFKVQEFTTKRTRHKSMGDIESVRYHTELRPCYNDNRYYKHGSGSGRGSASATDGNKKEKKQTKRQLFTPQANTNATYWPQNRQRPNTETNNLTNYVVPSWREFRFNVDVIWWAIWNA